MSRIRVPLRIALATLLSLAAHAARSADFTPSQHLESIPNPPCDVVVTEANAASVLTYLNLSVTGTDRVFCITPGDYRSLGVILLTSSGTEQSRRYLRFHTADGAQTAIQRAERALFEEIRVGGRWWVIQGLTVQPRNPTTAWFVSIYGGDHNVIDGNLIDGVEQVNSGGHSGVVLAAYSGDPATYNTVQRNVVRNGNQSRLPVDYFGILVRPGFQPGDDNDWNEILDNEVSDWGDGIALGGYTGDCSEPGVQHGTIIDGNDVYLTAAKRIDCNSGAPNPDGDCACAENGIDVKADPGPEAWTRITHNRLWGFRPTSRVVSCGGSGSNGQAISGGSVCPGHTLVANNVVVDAATGINPAGSDWIIAGNLLADIRAPSGWQFGALAINASQVAANLEIQFNTIVGVDSAYDDQSPNTDTRCNAVIDNNGLMGPGGPRGANHSTEHNFLYGSPTLNWEGASNAVFPTPEESGDSELCFWRKRWTSPEQVCVELAAPTPASPHATSAASCEPELGLPFGIGLLDYPRPAPEPRAAALELVGGLVLTALARTRRR